MDEPQRDLTLTRIFNAPRELVFRAWTEPELMAKWWGPDGVTNPTCEIDARVGGEIYIVMLAGNELGELAGQRWPMKGVFREIEEPSKLVFKNQAVTEDGRVLINGVTTVIFEEQDGKTKMTMTTTAKGMSAEAPGMLDGMKAGWSQSLDKLVELMNAKGAS